MRVLVCSLLLLSLQGCARDDVALGTDNNANNGGSSNGNTNTTGGKPKPEPDANNGDMNTSGDNASNGADANNGGDDGGGASGKCSAASCDKPTADLGEIDASDPDAVVMHSGKGSAFLTLNAADGNAGGALGPNNFVLTVGIRAALTAPAGSTYEVHVLGDLANGGNACGSNSSKGTAIETTAVWNGFGPVMPADDRKLSVEVRHIDGPCDKEWKLLITGLPCKNATTTDMSCP